MYPILVSCNHFNWIVAWYVHTEAKADGCMLFLHRPNSRKFKGFIQPNVDVLDGEWKAKYPEKMHTQNMQIQTSIPEDKYIRNKLKEQLICIY